MESTSGAYYARPEREQCRVNGKGCLDIPTLRIYCQAEGQSLSLCSVCYAGWRERVRTDTALALRCPVCAELSRPEPAAVPAAVAGGRPLTGEASRAIESAMHAEGIMIDVRRAVLLRLRLKAGWLEFASPQPDPEWVDS